MKNLVKQNMDIPEILEETPLLFLILDEAGNSKYTLRFSKSKAINETLVGVFLTAIISFVSVVILTLVMDLFDNGMIPFTIIDFEFSWTGSRAEEILTAWELNDGTQSSIIFNYLDFAFMLTYGSFGFSLVLLITQSFKDEGKSRKLGLICSVLPIIAAGFDVIENINLLIMQHNYPLTILLSLFLCTASIGKISSLL